MLQGRRKSQEDRIFCALDIRIPFPGKVGVKEVTVALVAVFDGHNGADAVTWLRNSYWSISFCIPISFWMPHF
ncbi:hypothetical protein SLA2020_262770 [Shorea laevis]